MKRVLNRYRARNKKAGLKRDITFFTAVVYGIGIILGAGVYALIGEAAALAGNSLWLSFVLGAVAASFTGMTYMEMISMFPKAAAEYLYVKNGFRSRLLAFNIGWVEIFTDIIATSAVALGFAGYLNALTGWPVVPSALGLVALMSFVNYMGIKESSRVNFVFSGIELGGLLLIIGLAIAFAGGSFARTDYFEMPNGFSGTVSAAALIFFAYLGFEELANLAEETKDARRTVPRALLVSVVVTTILYIAVAVSAVALVGWDELASSQAPLATAASSVFGDGAFLLVSVIALFATGNTVLVGLIVGSRTMFGMARDGSLPKPLAAVDKRRRTPWVSVLVAMLMSMAFVLVGKIALVASITDMGTFYMFALVNAAAILLRYRMPKARRAFRTPLNIGRLPIVPVVGFASSLLLASHLHTDALLVGLGLVAAGVAAYFVLDKKGKLRI